MTLLEYQNKKVRQSNFELLRIIAMIMIVAHHFCYHGHFIFPADSITMNKMWIQFWESGGKIGVNIFVLISGYFLIGKTNSMNVNKALKLWLQLFTYSTVIFVVFILLGREKYSYNLLITNLFPITYKKWWFASAYFIIYLISPYINRFLLSLDKKLYQRLLVLATLLCTVLPTFSGVFYDTSPILWFMYLYCVAGYIKLHAPKTEIKGWVYIALAFIISIIANAITAHYGIVRGATMSFSRNIDYYFNTQKLPSFLIALMLFIGFSKIDIGCNKTINVISSATFGVYLIHDNAYIRGVLWRQIFKCAEYTNKAYLIPYSLMVVATIFIGCILIELFRIYCIEKLYMKPLNKFSGFIERIIDKLYALKFWNKV